jgi:hypothetical protein
MAQKFVVRVLDADDALLAWAEVHAEPRPQARGASCPFFPITPTQFPIERDGVAAKLTIHWCDLDIARLTSLLEPTPVRTGQVFTFTWIEPVWLVTGMREVPLPAVTLRQSVALAVPTGQLTSIGTA